MFNNAEEKLKVFGKVILWLGLIASAALFIVFTFVFNKFVSGLIYLGSGVLGSMLSALLVYGVGETLEISKGNRSRIARLEDKISKQDNQSTKYQFDSSSAKTVNYSNNQNMVACSHCGKSRAANLTKCPYCGNEE